MCYEIGNIYYFCGLFSTWHKIFWPHGSAYQLDGKCKQIVGLLHCKLSRGWVSRVILQSGLPTPSQIQGGVAVVLNAQAPIRGTLLRVLWAPLPDSDLGGRPDYWGRQEVSHACFRVRQINSPCFAGGGGMRKLHEEDKKSYLVDRACFTVLLVTISELRDIVKSSCSLQTKYRPPTRSRGSLSLPFNLRKTWH